MADAISLSDYLEEKWRKKRLRSAVPYCGPCLEADGEINDLVAYKRYGEPNGLYCAECGEEFDE